ncbi:MAG: DNA primase [Gemmatimonadota bacterium]
MSMIPEDVIDQVRDSADVIGIIGESVELKRSGADWRGPCPFHGGRNRNFAVIPKKGLFYCYKCHEAGDVFSYLMKRFGMDYPTAVRDVARRSGIVIPDRPTREGPDPNEPLYGAVAAAHDWFVRQLAGSPEARTARDYLIGRGVTPEATAELMLGYAPHGKATLDAMHTLGVTDGVLLNAGLAAKRDDGSVVSRFRGRLIFPIHDQRGRVVAFGGRILGDGEPKYLNSPESEIFRKGRTLYNLHAAKHAIRKEETVILVEGYFDVIRLALAGVENVVAPLGTALTHDQAALLRRFAPTAVLLYDSDQAGLKATFRAGDELLRQAARVRVATMPPGEDPDTLVRKGGAAALSAVLTDAVDVLERKIQLLERRGWFENLEHRRDALDRLLPTVRAATDPITRELYLSRVAERAGVDKRVLEAEVARISARAPIDRTTALPGGGGGRDHGGGDGGAGGPGLSRKDPHDDAPRTAPRLIASRDEWELLRIAFFGEQWRDLARDHIKPEWLRAPAARELYLAVLTHGPALLPGTDIELSEPAAELWSRVKSRLGELGTQNIQSMFDSVWQTLAARPLIMEYEKMRAQMLVATEDEKADLMVQLNARRQELRDGYRIAFDKWAFRKHRRRRREQKP